MLNPHTSTLDSSYITANQLTYSTLSMMICLNLDSFYQHIDHIFITHNDSEFFSILSSLSKIFKESQTDSFKAIVLDFENSTALHLSFNPKHLKVNIQRERYSNYHSSTITDQLSSYHTNIRFNYIMSNHHSNNPFCLLLLAQNLILIDNPDSNFILKYQSCIQSSEHEDHNLAIQGYKTHSLEIDNIQELLYKVEAQKFTQRFNEQSENNQDFCETSF